MFKNEFQGGNFFEIINPSLKDPLTNCKIVGSHGIQKVFDKEVKGSIYQLEGTPSVTKISIPKESKQGLSLVQRILVFQINVKPNHDFNLEIGITDLSLNRRNLSFSTSHKELNIQPLSARLPMKSINRDQWTNLVFDLAALINDLWKNQTFKSIDFISISANCKLRKIFTLKNLPNIEYGFFIEESLSQIDFPEGTTSRTQLFTIEDAKSNDSTEKLIDNFDTTQITKTKSQHNVFKIAFGTKVPSINSQKQGPQQQQPLTTTTSLLKISNSQPQLINQNDLLNNSLKNTNISPLSISNGHLSNSSNDAESSRRKSLSDKQYNQSNQPNGKMSWSKHGTSSSKLSSVENIRGGSGGGSGGGGGGFLRLDQTHDLTSPSPALMLSHYQNHSESHNHQNQTSNMSTAVATQEQTVPPPVSSTSKIMPRPPPQSTRPARGSGHRKIRLPPKQQQQQQQQQLMNNNNINEPNMITNHNESSSKPAPTKIPPIVSATYEIASSLSSSSAPVNNVEDDVHNHSSKTIIDLIQPSRVKLAHFYAEPSRKMSVDTSAFIEKDSLNIDDAAATFTKSKLTNEWKATNKHMKPVNNSKKSTTACASAISNMDDLVDVVLPSPPTPSLLASSSRNMNYDHRKYTNIGSVFKQQTQPSQLSAAPASKPTAASASSLVNAETITAAAAAAAAAETMNDLMDSFEARMLQEMKAEMDAEKLTPPKQHGSSAARRRAGGSTRTTTTTTTTTSGIGSSNTTAAATNDSAAMTTVATNHTYEEAHENNPKGSDDDLHDADLSPTNHRRASSAASGLQSPYSDEHDQQTTSEKYNFDAMTSSIEDTTTSLSKKGVNRKAKSDDANNYQDEMNVSLLAHIPTKSINLKDLPTKYSPLSSQPPSQLNKIHQSPINEEPTQYDDSQADIDEIISDSDEDEDDEIDLLYDPSLNCYYDPKTCTYYELNLS